MGLIGRLTELQDAKGHLVVDDLRELARQERVPLYRLQEIISFYPHFRTTPPPKIEVAVCRDMACWLADGPAKCGRLKKKIEGMTDVEMHQVSCLGRCEQAPAAVLCASRRDRPGGAPEHQHVITVHALLATDLSRWPDWPQQALSQSRHRWRCDPYPTATDRYGVVRELFATTPFPAERIIQILKESGLRGMGGAGFPTGTKWELVRKENRTPKYVICNADESEPGTFKDRVILGELPHLVIEGMILAGLVVGAERGILYIRHEYAPEREAFASALADARSTGRVPAGFDIEIFVSPGGYILGEETALLEALEDRRGEPRNKPPFPGTHGLHGRPTLINNVETLAVVPAIVTNGAEWWKAQGRPGFAGLKFIALSGHVERPGVYEIATGTTVRELLESAGGVKDGKPLLAFAPGGASSNFLPASMIDVPLDFNALAKAGSMLGSGAVVVVAEGTDMLALATNVVRFFRNESCGKCVPCRLGSQYAVDLLEQVQNGQSPRTSLEVLADLADTMTQTSICGLGQVALNPVLSVLKHWPEASEG